MHHLWACDPKEAPGDSPPPKHRPGTNLRACAAPCDLYMLGGRPACLATPSFCARAGTGGKHSSVPKPHRRM
jgi:hypothetical protein